MSNLLMDEEKEGLVINKKDIDEIDNYKKIINNDENNRNNTDCNNFRIFMQNYFVKGPNQFNIISVNPNGKYYIGPENIGTFFQKIKDLYTKKLVFPYAEYQAIYSGMMFDFDVKHKNNTTLITSIIIESIIRQLMFIIVDHIDTNDEKEIITYVAVTKRNRPTLYETDDNLYKDGFHILVPGIQVTKLTKKKIIREFNKKIDTIKYIFRSIELCVPYDKILDELSCSIPIFYIGADRNVKKKIYDIHEIYKVTIPCMINDTSLISIESFKEMFTQSNINLQYEFSMNYEYQLIKKKRYEIKKKYNTEIINDYDQIDFNDNEDLLKRLDISSINNFKIIEIKKILDILNPERYEDYNEWMKILYILKSYSEHTKDLAEYASRKSKKFNLNEFYAKWESIQINKTNEIGINSLIYKAKQDNPIAYRAISLKLINTELYKKSRDKFINGNIGEVDIADIIFKMVQYKYITTTIGRDLIWYEFITPEDIEFNYGYAYKWMKHSADPKSLDEYLSSDKNGIRYVFSNLILETMKEQADANQDKIKYYQILIKNLRQVYLSLLTYNKLSTLKKILKSKFKDDFFYMRLNTDNYLMGVKNGVLDFSESKVKLINHFHDHAISVFAPVNYCSFDPTDDATKKILITLRKMVPDNESDAFEFIMSYVASGLFIKVQRPFILFLIGKGSNGKSFLLELIRSAFGSEYCKKMTISFLTSKNEFSETATPQLMLLRPPTKVLLYTESNKNDVLNMAHVKLIGGTDILSGRNLYASVENFKSSCIHVVTSNFSFIITDTDHGSWRRIKKYNMKITFVPNINNKALKINERKEDPDIDQWKNDDIYISKFLSILVFYYVRLRVLYNGDLININCPTIDNETDEYKYEQDHITKFIDLHYYKYIGDEKKDNDHIIRINEIVENCKKWLYDTNAPIILLRDINIKTFIENDRFYGFTYQFDNKYYLRGFKYFEIDEKPTKDYQCLNIKKNNIIIKSETPEEYYENICKEYKIYSKYL